MNVRRVRCPDLGPDLATPTSDPGRSGSCDAMSATVKVTVHDLHLALLLQMRLPLRVSWKVGREGDVVGGAQARQARLASPADPLTHRSQCVMAGRSHRTQAIVSRHGRAKIGPHRGSGTYSSRSQKPEGISGTISSLADSRNSPVSFWTLNNETAGTPHLRHEDLYTPMTTQRRACQDIPITPSRQPAHIGRLASTPEPYLPTLAWKRGH